MSIPTIFFIHGESSVFDANKSYFDFINQDNYDLYCNEENPDPYSFGNNRESIITMQCGHYVNKNILLTHIFPSFPLCCTSPECLENSADYCLMCNNVCVFVCDLCSNFVSEPHTIKHVIENGIEIVISINNINAPQQLIERKRKFEQNMDDNAQNKKFC
jgi:hypothetical protein